MSIRNLYIIIGLVLAFGLFFGIVAYAQDASQETEIRFSAPVQIPEGVLRAGTYLFKTTDSDDNVVRVLSADGTRLYAMVPTMVVERSITEEDLVVTMAAPDSGSPNFLVKWFYPGSLVGHALVYSGKQEQEMAQATSRTSIASQVLAGTPVGGN